MSDYMKKQDVLDILYNTFEEYNMTTDKQDKHGGFGIEVFKRVKELPTLDETEIIRKPFERVVEELKKEVMIEDILSKNSTGEFKKMHTYGRNCLNVAIKKIKECGINE